MSKLKSGQPRNVICEITGHARESSLDDYDEMDKNQRKEIWSEINGKKFGLKSYLWFQIELGRNHAMISDQIALHSVQLPLLRGAF